MQLFLNEIRIQMVNNVWREQLHERISISKFSHYPILFHSNQLNQLLEYLCRTAQLFFSIYALLLTQNLSSTDQDPLRHRLNNKACSDCISWTFLCFRRGIQASETKNVAVQVSMDKFTSFIDFHSMCFKRMVSFLLLTYWKFQPTLAAFYVVLTHFLQKF